MLCLGLDIGTTTISAVVTENGDTVIDALTKTHHGFYENTPAWERVQNPQLLLGTALELTEQLCQKHDIRCIGITGQQHGIVYLDENGEILSPLYTWQDGRGNLPFGDSTYTRYLQEQSGYALATGYGLVTHYYNLCNGLVPENTACFCTIHDLVAMKLAGLKRPVMEPSDAHSLGFFDLESDQFDTEAISRCGMDPSILPEVRRCCVLGRTQRNIPVVIAIGDNPASFLGAAGNDRDCVLLNIGTGSQISVLCQDLLSAAPMETRPFPLGGYLLAGAALCGGKAWALTERFFSDAVFALTGQRISAYEGLDRLLADTEDSGVHPTVATTFDGTRQDPNRRASILDLTAENFTPGALALGVLHGMIDELYGMYRVYLDTGNSAKQRIIGSGNGLRLNRHLQRIASQTFGAPLTMSTHREEAALGAARYAITICKEEM